MEPDLCSPQTLRKFEDLKILYLKIIHNACLVYNIKNAPVITGAFLIKPCLGIVKCISMNEIFKYQIFKSSNYFISRTEGNLFAGFNGN